MANLLRTLTRKQLNNRNISTLSHRNPFFSSGSSLDPNLSSGFRLFGNGVGLDSSNDGFRMNEKVTHLKFLGLDPFLSSWLFSDPNLPSGFGSSQGESKCGDRVGSSDKGLRVNEKVTHFKRCGLDPFLSFGSFLDRNLPHGLGLSQGGSKFGNGFGLNPSTEGFLVNEKVDHLKRYGLDPFVSSGLYLDPDLTNGFGLSHVVGSWGDDVEDSGMMWADSVKKKRKKKMNKHKYKKLRKRLRRKTKT